MLAPLAALLLGASLAPAQQFAGVPALADSLAGLRFSRSATGSSASGVRGAAAAAPDVSAYPVRGIDVSVWQGRIDWAKTAAAGVSFAYIKATEGAALVDDEFARNWAEADKAGVPRGAYHFWDFCAGGAAQAAHVLKTVPRDASALPLTIDIEKSRPCRRLPTKQAFQKSLSAFLAAVEKAYGRQPLLYVNRTVYEEYLSGADHGLKIWIADPHDQSPVMPAGAAWTLWQYSWKGRLPGIDADVDLDVFNGTPEQLAALTRPAPAALASR